jgi:uncharacterized membrane protein
MLHALMPVAYTLHIGGGVIGLMTGTVAILAPKGRPVHRTTGGIFVAAMLIMAIFGVVLAALIPGQLINVFIGIFAFYLVGTAWLAVWRRPGITGLAERLAALVGCCLCAPFVILSVDLAAGLPPLFHSSIDLAGPVLIALYAFTLILVIAAATDLRLVLSGGITGAPRIARHLWRMCLGLTLAAGSGFTNGVARLLPGPYHVPMVLFLPQFLPLILLFVWMIRVRFTGWFRTSAVAHVA